MIRWLRNVVIVSVLLATSLVACQVSGHYWIKGELRAWKAAGMPLEGLEPDFPDRPTSPSAHRLDELIRPLGILFFMPAGQWGPAMEQMREDEDLRAVREWVLSFSTKTDDGLEAPPRALAAFLAAHGGEIDEIVSHLLKAEDLGWMQRVNYEQGPPVPPVEALLLLQPVLLAHVLERSQGHPAESAAALEAVWRLHESVVHRPAWAAQETAMELAQQHNGVLRQLDPVSPEWETRLASHDHGRRLARVHRLEASHQWGWWETAETPDPGQSAYDQFLHRFVTTGSSRWALARFLAALREASERARIGGLCELDGEALVREIEEGPPLPLVVWRLYDGTLLSNALLSRQYGYWGAFQRASVDAELTRRVLRARKTREGTGHWPAPATQTSEACPDLTWRQVVEGDGSYSIRAEGWIPSGAGEIEELRFTLSP